MQLWNARDGSQLFTYPDNYSYQVFSVAWSPDSTRLATGSRDNIVQVWNAHDGKQPFTHRGHRDVVYSVAWSPNGTRLASGSDDGTVQVWQAV
jgi:eukaryotic-like serine/threonine-protein kinase